MIGERLTQKYKHLTLTEVTALLFKEWFTDHTTIELTRMQFIRWAHRRLMASELAFGLESLRMHVYLEVGEMIIESRFSHIVTDICSRIFICVGSCLCIPSDIAK
jgi:hypothetical protein